MIRHLTDFLRRMLPVSVPPAAPEEPAGPTPLPAIENAGHLPDARRGRPMSATMRRTLTLMEGNPSITAAELSNVLKVTPSYARTLLRRARERQQGERVSPPTKDSERVVSRLLPGRVRDRQGEGVSPQTTDLEQVMSRLEAAEQEISRLRGARPATESAPRWDLSRRAEVIRRGLAGESAPQIASSLSVAEGEVRFILKVHRLLMSAGGIFLL